MKHWCNLIREMEKFYFQQQNIRCNDDFKIYFKLPNVAKG